MGEAQLASPEVVRVGEDAYDVEAIGVVDDALLVTRKCLATGSRVLVRYGVPQELDTGGGRSQRGHVDGELLGALAFPQVLAVALPGRIVKGGRDGDAERIRHRRPPCSRIQADQRLREQSDAEGVRDAVRCARRRLPPPLERGRIDGRRLAGIRRSVASDHLGRERVPDRPAKRRRLSRDCLQGATRWGKCARRSWRR